MYLVRSLSSFSGLSLRCLFAKLQRGVGVAVTLAREVHSHVIIDFNQVAEMKQEFETMLAEQKQKLGETEEKQNKLEIELEKAR